MVALGDIFPFFSTKNSKDYIRRTQEPYRPPDNYNLHQIRAALPKRLFDRGLIRGLWLWGRDFLVCGALFWSATKFNMISDAFATMTTGETSGPKFIAAKYALKTPLWLWYWWWGALQFAGIWFNGHEASHGSLTYYNWLNDCLGLVNMMFVLNPYFSWKISHKIHHKGAGNIDKEDSYVPIYRGMYIEDNPRAADKLLPMTPSDHRTIEKQAEERERLTGSRYSLIYDAVEETPMAVLLTRFVAAFTFGWNGYIMFNVGGNRVHRPGASHFVPHSPLFLPNQRIFVALSDVAILCMMYVLYDLGRMYGGWNLFVYYGVTYLCSNFVLTWVTVLQHVDATVPHFRDKDWNFFKGALATIDREFYGWQGNFFVHGASRNHVAHHFFPEMPCTAHAEATAIIAPMLGHNYVFDDTPPLYALWRTYHECQFVEENDGDTLFFRDRVGRARRGMPEDLLPPSALKDQNAATATSTGYQRRSLLPRSG